MTSTPLCLPTGNGRQASRTGPRIKRRHGRLFVAPPGRANLLYYLFLVLLIVGCSSGQGRLEASADTVRAEAAEVDAVEGIAHAETPTVTETPTSTVTETPLTVTSERIRNWYRIRSPASR